MAGMKVANNSLYNQLRNKLQNVYVIGDAAALVIQVQLGRCHELERSIKLKISGKPMPCGASLLILKNIYQKIIKKNE
jgi:hypothetical protein